MKPEPLTNSNEPTVSRFLVEGSGREDIVVRALQECQNAIDEGKSIDRAAMVAKYPEIRDELSACLEGLELMLGSATNAKDESQIKPLATLGDFRIVDEIGRGGMGVVYEAEQLSVGRRVALKVLPYASMLDKRQIARFQNEARAAATLEHPHIVPVHFVGNERGVHYYAMRLIEGKNLVEVMAELKQLSNDGNASDEPPLSRSASSLIETGISNSKVDPGDKVDNPETVKDLGNAPTNIKTGQGLYGKTYFESVARIGKQIAEALDFAHSYGIIHRDIKPANIMLDDVGDAWVTDFGLARIEADAGMTMTGDLIGTLRYMSPEQALADRIAVDHRSDIYSLGATLYELLTLQPVFTAKDRAALFGQIAGNDPVVPSRIVATIPKDLETIVLKSLQKAPDDRYASAKEFAEDIERFILHQPVLARRTPMLQRVRMWSRRHPAFVAASIVVMFAVLASLSVAGIIVANKERSVRLEVTNALDKKEDALKQSNVNLQLARENLQIAITAVNEMNNNIATNWIANDQDLSDTQINFLTRSGVLFRQIASQFGQDSEFQFEAATAYRNSAMAFQRVGKYDDATSAYKSAVRLFSSESSEAPEDASISSELASTLAQLGDLYVTLGQLEHAEEYFTLAADAYTQLRVERPDVDNYALMLAHIDYGRSHLALTRGRMDHVIRISQKILDELEVLDSQDENTQAKAFRRTILVSLQLVRAHRALGNVAESLEIGTNILKKSRIRLRNAQDDRELVSQLASIQSEVGRSQMEQRDYALAETNLKEAMSKLKSTFLFDGTPTEFIVEAMKGNVSDSLMQPVAFVQYAEMQVYFGMLCLRTGRPVDGFIQVDEAVRMAKYFDEIYPGSVQFIGVAFNATKILSKINLNTPQFGDGVEVSIRGKQSQKALIESQLNLVMDINVRLRELAGESPDSFLKPACDIGAGLADLLNKARDHTKAMEVSDEIVSLINAAAKEQPTERWISSLLKKYQDFSIRLGKLNLENPENANTYIQRAGLNLFEGDDKNALKDYEQALALDPKLAIAFNGAAWILATSPNEELRDGDRAIELATRVCELTDWKQTFYFDTLAAAYAEAGKFDLAVEWQTKATESAPEKERPDYQKRLDIYLSGNQYRESK